MPRSSSEQTQDKEQKQEKEKVPQKMRPVFDAVVAITDAFCREHLTEEYARLCRRAAAALSRKRPSLLLTGRVETWACGIAYAIGSVNFLFDKAQTPHMNAGQLCAWFGVAKSTASAKSRTVQDVLGIGVLDPRWTLPDRMSFNRLKAFHLGLIPYLP